MKRWLRALEDVVWPPICFGCQQALAAGLQDFCPECSDELARIDGVICQRCGLGAPRGVAEAEIGWLCRDCHSGSRAFAFARSALTLDGLGQELLHRWKYRREEVLGPALGRLLSEVADERLAVWVSQRALVVPVPTDPWRRLWRGFDQGVELAGSWASTHHLTLARALRRAKRRGKQVGRSARQRREGWSGVFVLRRRWLARVKQRPVILVDDVFTTGSTLEAATVALKMAGCPDVAVLTLMRET